MTARKVADEDYAPKGPPQIAAVTPRGNSYEVAVQPLDAHFMFRDVRVSGELKADITIRHHEKHLFRSTSTLNLIGRDRVAKTAAELDSGDGEAWRLAVFAATEAIMDAEEKAGEWTDLRYSEESNATESMLVEGFFPQAATVLVAPNSAGKSTFGRAIALSVAAGVEVIPGLIPTITGPVLYVAGEDGVVKYHTQHMAAMCRGLGIDRDKIGNSIRLYNTGGRPLAQIARSVAERAFDCAAVILDSHQALLGGVGGEGNIRDRDSAFWNALDQINRPSLTIAHPNRADRQNWKSADGSIAGSDVNQDRARCAWKGRWREDDDPMMSMARRRYTLDNTKWSHGPLLSSVSFAVERYKDGIGQQVLKFVPSGDIPNEDVRAVGRPVSVYAETRDAYNAGAKTPEALAKALDVSYDTARMRLNRYKKDLQESVG